MSKYIIEIDQIKEKIAKEMQQIIEKEIKMELNSVRDIIKEDMKNEMIKEMKQEILLELYSIRDKIKEEIKQEFKQKIKKDMEKDMIEEVQIELNSIKHIMKQEIEEEIKEKMKKQIKDSIKEKEIIELNCRGTIIKVPTTILKYSKLLNTLYEDTHTTSIYLNYDPKIVHNMINNIYNPASIYDYLNIKSFNSQLKVNINSYKKMYQYEIIFLVTNNSPIVLYLVFDDYLTSYININETHYNATERKDLYRKHLCDYRNYKYVDIFFISSLPFDTKLLIETKVLIDIIKNFCDKKNITFESYVKKSNLACEIFWRETLNFCNNKSQLHSEILATLLSINESVICQNFGFKPEILRECIDKLNKYGIITMDKN
jgi:hypothetical protein